MAAALAARPPDPRQAYRPSSNSTGGRSLSSPSKAWWEMDSPSMSTNSSPFRVQSKVTKAHTLEKTFPLYAESADGQENVDANRMPAQSHTKRRRDFGVVPLSSSEAERLTRQEEQRRRKLRIQQVREQERLFASVIRRRYQTMMDKSRKKVLDKSQRDWDAAKGRAVAAATEQRDRALVDIGLGHRQAREIDEAQAKMALEQQEIWRQKGEIAAERQRWALCDDGEQKRVLAEPERMRKEKQEIWDNAATAERKKAVMKAEVERKRNAQKAALDAQRGPELLQDINIERESRQLTIGAQLTDYAHTRIRHGIVRHVIKGQQQTGGHLSGMEAAKEAQQLARERYEAREKQRRVQEEEAKKRGKSAMSLVTAEKDRKELEATLERLDTADRAAKLRKAERGETWQARQRGLFGPFANDKNREERLERAFRRAIIAQPATSEEEAKDAFPKDGKEVASDYKRLETMGLHRERSTFGLDSLNGELPRPRAPVPLQSHAPPKGSEAEQTHAQQEVQEKEGDFRIPTSSDFSGPSGYSSHLDQPVGKRHPPQFEPQRASEMAKTSSKDRERDRPGVQSQESREAYGGIKYGERVQGVEESKFPHQDGEDLTGQSQSARHPPVRHYSAREEFSPLPPQRYREELYSEYIRSSRRDLTTYQGYDRSSTLSPDKQGAKSAGPAGTQISVDSPAPLSISSQYEEEDDQERALSIGKLETDAGEDESELTAYSLSHRDVGTSTGVGGEDSFASRAPPLSQKSLHTGSLSGSRPRTSTVTRDEYQTSMASETSPVRAAVHRDEAQLRPIEKASDNEALRRRDDLQELDERVRSAIERVQELLKSDDDSSAGDDRRQSSTLGQERAEIDSSPQVTIRQSTIEAGEGDRWNVTQTPVEEAGSQRPKTEVEKLEEDVRRLRQERLKLFSGRMLTRRLSEELEQTPVSTPNGSSTPQGSTPFQSPRRTARVLSETSVAFAKLKRLEETGSGSQNQSEAQSSMHPQAAPRADVPKNREDSARSSQDWRRLHTEQESNALRPGKGSSEHIGVDTESSETSVNDRGGWRARVEALKRLSLSSESDSEIESAPKPAVVSPKKTSSDEEDRVADIYKRSLATSTTREAVSARGDTQDTSDDDGSTLSDYIPRRLQSFGFGRRDRLTELQYPSSDGGSDAGQIEGAKQSSSLPRPIASKDKAFVLSASSDSEEEEERELVGPDPAGDEGQGVLQRDAATESKAAEVSLPPIEQVDHRTTLAPSSSFNLLHRSPSPSLSSASKDADFQQAKEMSRQAAEQSKEHENSQKEGKEWDSEMEINKEETAEESDEEEDRYRSALAQKYLNPLYASSTSESPRSLTEPTLDISKLPDISQQEEGEQEARGSTLEARTSLTATIPSDSEEEEEDSPHLSGDGSTAKQSLASELLERATPSEQRAVDESTTSLTERERGRNEGGAGQKSLWALPDNLSAYLSGVHHRTQALLGKRSDDKQQDSFRWPGDSTIPASSGVRQAQKRDAPPRRARSGEDNDTQNKNMSAGPNLSDSLSKWRVTWNDSKFVTTTAESLYNPTASIDQEQSTRGSPASSENLRQLSERIAITPPTFRLDGADLSGADEEEESFEERAEDLTFEREQQHSLEEESEDPIAAIWRAEHPSRVDVSMPSFSSTTLLETDDIANLLRREMDLATDEDPFAITTALDQFESKDFPLSRNDGKTHYGSSYSPPDSRSLSPAAAPKVSSPKSSYVTSFEPDIQRSSRGEDIVEDNRIQRRALSPAPAPAPTPAVRSKQLSKKPASQLKRGVSVGEERRNSDAKKTFGRSLSSGSETASSSPRRSELTRPKEQDSRILAKGIVEDFGATKKSVDRSLSSASASFSPKRADMSSFEVDEPLSPGIQHLLATENIHQSLSPASTTFPVSPQSPTKLLAKLKRGVSTGEEGTKSSARRTLRRSLSSASDSPISSPERSTFVVGRQNEAQRTAEDTEVSVKAKKSQSQTLSSASGSGATSSISPRDNFSGRTSKLDVHEKTQVAVADRKRITRATSSESAPISPSKRDIETTSIRSAATDGNRGNLKASGRKKGSIFDAVKQYMSPSTNSNLEERSEDSRMQVPTSGRVLDFKEVPAESKSAQETGIAVHRTNEAATETASSQGGQSGRSIERKDAHKGEPSRDHLRVNSGGRGAARPPEMRASESSAKGVSAQEKLQSLSTESPNEDTESARSQQGKHKSSGTLERHDSRRDEDKRVTTPGAHYEERKSASSAKLSKPGSLLSLSQTWEEGRMSSVSSGSGGDDVHAQDQDITTAPQFDYVMEEPELTDTVNTRIPVPIPAPFMPQGREQTSRAGERGPGYWEGQYPAPSSGFISSMPPLAPVPLPGPGIFPYGQPPPLPLYMGHGPPFSTMPGAPQYAQMPAFGGNLPINQPQYYLPPQQQYYQPYGPTPPQPPQTGPGFPPIPPPRDITDFVAAERWVEEQMQRSSSSFPSNGRFASNQTREPTPQVPFREEGPQDFRSYRETDREGKRGTSYGKGSSYNPFDEFMNSFSAGNLSSPLAGPAPAPPPPAPMMPSMFNPFSSSRAWGEGEQTPAAPGRQQREQSASREEPQTHTQSADQREGSALEARDPVAWVVEFPNSEIKGSDKPKKSEREVEEGSTKESKSEPTDVTAVEEHDIRSRPTLRDLLQQHDPSFGSRSQARVFHAKESRFEAKQKEIIGTGRSTASAETGRRAGRARTSSEASSAPSLAGGPAPPRALVQRLAKGSREKVETSEMRQRTQRMYSRLPEVKRQQDANQKRTEMMERQKKAKEQDQIWRRQLQERMARKQPPTKPQGSRSLR